MDDVAGRVGDHRGVSFAARGAMNLDRPIGEVEDPVLGYLGARIEGRFHAAVLAQRGFGDLDDQQRLGGVVVRIVLIGYDREIGFWF